MSAVSHCPAALAKRKAFLRYLANLFEIAERVEQIQQACIGGSKTALERIGLSFRRLADLFGVWKYPLYLQLK